MLDLTPCFLDLSTCCHLMMSKRSDHQQAQLTPCDWWGCQVVDRARREDLDQPLQYPCRFVRNSKGQPVIDRLFNTVSLLDVYMGKAGVPSDAVQWDIENPNNLELRMPGRQKLR